MRYLSLLSFLFLLNHSLFSQSIPDLRLNLNESGSHYFRVTLMNQTWMRLNQSNPGTLVDGTPKDQTFDIGLRRTRIQLFGQLTDKVFVYSQFGMNNFNRVSARKTGAFFHDATCEYHFIPELHFGAGLNAWVGMSRFSAPSAGAILGMDTPLFAQATNDASDQFIRKLSIYFKGEIGKLNYRVSLADPLSADMGSQLAAVPGPQAGFRPAAASLQPQAYLAWQFFEKEGAVMPYKKGSWLGRKKVLNLGAGFISQKDAMWNVDVTGDTLNHNILLLAADLFLDLPVGKGNGSAVSAYAGIFNYDFGPGYLRNVGPMNPADGFNSNVSLNGPGNGTPMVGTGQIYYLQAGYKFRDQLLGQTCGTLQPYFQVMLGNFDRLDATATLLNAGVNWLISGHNAKFSLNYENRPVFNPDAAGNVVSTDRKGAFVLQYQIAL